MSIKIDSSTYTGGSLSDLITHTRSLYGMFQRIVPFVTDMTNSELAAELGVTDATAGNVKTTLTNGLTTLESANMEAIRTDVYW